MAFYISKFAVNQQQFLDSDVYVLQISYKDTLVPSEGFVYRMHRIGK